MGLAVDDAVPKTLIFGRDDNSWGEEQIILKLSAGIHNIALSFLNDATTEQGDRNSYLDWLKIEYVDSSR